MLPKGSTQAKKPKTTHFCAFSCVKGPRIPKISLATTPDHPTKHSALMLGAKTTPAAAETARSMANDLQQAARLHSFPGQP